MTGKLRIHNYSVSLDGYGAGPDQSTDAPLGVGGEDLHPWLVQTRTFHAMTGREGGDTGVDDRFAAAGDAGIGASIMGRNMFGPIRGPWPDASWTGWWGDEPPYQHDVFVLTHHAREPQPMRGGTTFYFVTGGITEALDRARAAAGDADVRLLGGAATIREYLRAGLVDEMHLAVVPIVLGAGERLLDDVGGPAFGYECVEIVASAGAAHLRFARR